jgi:hypothetical protein
MAKFRSVSYSDGISQRKKYPSISQMFVSEYRISNSSYSMYRNTVLYLKVGTEPNSAGPIGT